MPPPPGLPKARGLPHRSPPPGLGICPSARLRGRSLGRGRRPAMIRQEVPWPGTLAQTPRSLQLLAEMRRSSVEKLEKLELLAGARRGRKQIGAKLDRALIHSEPVCGHLESAADHPGIRPVANHPFAPLRIVELAAPRRAHQRQHALGSIWAVGLQPFGEEIADLERKPE